MNIADQLHKILIPVTKYRFVPALKLIADGSVTPVRTFVRDLVDWLDEICPSVENSRDTGGGYPYLTRYLGQK